jgi:hypothetical protein
MVSLARAPRRVVTAASETRSTRPRYSLRKVRTDGTEHRAADEVEVAQLRRERAMRRRRWISGLTMRREAVPAGVVNVADHTRSQLIRLE